MRTFMCAGMFGAFSHWVIFYSANNLTEIDGIVLQKNNSVGVRLAEPGSAADEWDVRNEKYLLSSLKTKFF